jgi:hypothetical protein
VVSSVGRTDGAGVFNEVLGVGVVGPLKGTCVGVRVGIVV